MRIGRRNFLVGAGAIGASAALPRMAEAAPVRAPIDMLDRRDVSLFEGPAQAQQAQTLEALLAMDEARLLRPFRERAGLPISDDRFGGWYDFVPEFHSKQSMVGFIPGHSFGQYMSSLARAFAVTGDARAKAKVDRMVAGYAPTIRSDFYLSLIHI